MNFYFSIEIVGIVQTSCGIRNIFQSLSSLDLKCFGFLFSHCLFSNFRYIVGASSQSQKIDTTHRSIKNGKKIISSSPPFRFSSHSHVESF